MKINVEPRCNPGFVKLQPKDPDVPNGTFIRRLTYTTSEISVNTASMNEVVTKQGPDKLSTWI